MLAIDLSPYDFFCLHEDKSKGEKIITGCLTHYSQLCLLRTLPGEEGDTEREENGCRIADILVTGLGDL